jgi:hypothetical protein
LKTRHRAVRQVGLPTNSDDQTDDQTSGIPRHAVLFASTFDMRSEYATALRNPCDDVMDPAKWNF